MIRPLLKMTYIELKLFVREPLAVIFAFAFPFFVLFVLAGVFGNEEPVDSEDFEIWRGVGPTDYYVPAYVGLVMASVGLISLPLRLAGYRERGVLKRFHAAGTPLGVLLGAHVAVFFVMSGIGGVAIAVAGRIVYGSPLPTGLAGQLTQVLGAFVLSGLAFAAIGVMLGAVLRTARAAQGAGLALFFVMMFICGAGPPRGVLTDAMYAVSNALPLTHVILVIQGPWLGLGWDWPASAIVVAFLVVTGALGVRFFRWE